MALFTCECVYVVCALAKTLFINLAIVLKHKRLIRWPIALAITVVATPN